MRCIDADNLKSFFFSKTSGTEEILQDLIEEYSSGIGGSITIYGDDAYDMLVELLKKVTNVIDAEPTVEVEPVKHGHWEFCAESVDTMWDCRCSVCGSVEQPLQRHHYCPYCGAKMDEVE